MRKYFFAGFILGVICNTTVNAQELGNFNTVGEFNKYIAQNWAGDYVRIGGYKVKGTPYLLGESFPGTLVYKGGAKSDTKILYDLYNQKVGADVKNNILETDQVLEEFTITLPGKFGGNTLFFKNTEAFGNTSMKSYFNVLEDGTKAALLKTYKIKLASDPSNNMDKDSKIFEQYYEYYFYNKTTKELNKTKLKEKDIAKQLGDETFVKDYASRNTFDASNEIDLIRLVKAYNTK